jgi:ribonuclease HII
VKPCICGFDEAGRGPLAGPVAAAAVMLPPDFQIDVLNDSKKLSEARRDQAAALITAQAVWGIGWAEAGEIDKINILEASLLAMSRAWLSLEEKCLRGSCGSWLQNNFGNFREKLKNIEGIADGLYIPEVPFPCRALVKADAQVPEVMAASILAKTARDKLMKTYALFYPEYGYERHKGYPTQAHLRAVAQYGPSPIQRASFKIKPVQLTLFPASAPRR